MSEIERVARGGVDNARTSYAGCTKLFLAFTERQLDLVEDRFSPSSSRSSTPRGDLSDGEEGQRGEEKGDPTAGTTTPRGSKGQHRNQFTALQTTLYIPLSSIIAAEQTGTTKKKRAVLIPVPRGSTLVREGWTADSCDLFRMCRETFSVGLKGDAARVRGIPHVASRSRDNNNERQALAPSGDNRSDSKQGLVSSDAVRDRDRSYRRGEERDGGKGNVRRDRLDERRNGSDAVRDGQEARKRGDEEIEKKVAMRSFISSSAAWMSAKITKHVVDRGKGTYRQEEAEDAHDEEVFIVESLEQLLVSSGDSIAERKSETGEAISDAESDGSKTSTNALAHGAAKFYLDDETKKLLLERFAENFSFIVCLLDGGSAKVLEEKKAVEGMNNGHGSRNARCIKDEKLCKVKIFLAFVHPAVRDDRYWVPVSQFLSTTSESSSSDDRGDCDLEELEGNREGTKPDRGKLQLARDYEIYSLNTTEKDGGISTDEINREFYKAVKDYNKVVERAEREEARRRRKGREKEREERRKRKKAEEEERKRQQEKRVVATTFKSLFARTGKSEAWKQLDNLEKLRVAGLVEQEEYERRKKELVNSLTGTDVSNIDTQDPSLQSHVNSTARAPEDLFDDEMPSRKDRSGSSDERKRDKTRSEPKQLDPIISWKDFVITKFDGSVLPVALCPVVELRRRLLVPEHDLEMSISAPNRLYEQSLDLRRNWQRLGGEDQPSTTKRKTRSRSGSRGSDKPPSIEPWEPQARRLFHHILVMQPQHSRCLTSLAQLQKSGRHPDLGEVDESYLRALRSNPFDADALASYALFLEVDTQQDEQAQLFYKRAMIADRKSANNMCNYAVFQKNILNHYDKAEKLYKRAIELDPTHLNSLGNYALFLQHIRRDMPRADDFFLRVLDESKKKGSDKRFTFWLDKYHAFLRQLKVEGSDYRPKPYLTDEERARERMKQEEKERSQKERERAERLEKERMQREIGERQRSNSEDAESAADPSEPNPHLARKPRERTDGFGMGADEAGVVKFIRHDKPFITLEEKRFIASFIDDLFRPTQNVRLVEPEDGDGGPKKKINGREDVRSPFQGDSDEEYASDDSDSEDRTCPLDWAPDSEEIAKFEALMACEMARRLMCKALNAQRAKWMHVASAPFAILSRAILVALNECNEAEDFRSAKKLMHMSATYFLFADIESAMRAPKGPGDKIEVVAQPEHERIYVQDAVRSAPIWKNNEFWSVAFYDQIYKERKKLDLLDVPWLSLTDEERKDLLKREQSVTFALLAGFSLTMLGMGLPPADVRNYVRKQAIANGLDDATSDILVANVDNNQPGSRHTEKASGDND